MLLIYTHKITERLTYTMKQVFTGILGIDVSFTTKVEDFIKHKGPKITYTKQPLQKEFFVRSNDVLFEQGINDLDIEIGNWDGVPCFFRAGESSSLPFDIFSASFYMLSRYEEYVPHVKDELGRFPAKESIAFRHKFLETPVVDVWAYKLFDVLKERFPEIQCKHKNYEHTSVINVTSSHCYKHRGFARSLGGFLLDLSSFKLRRIFDRIAVLTGFKKDPYDNFMHLIELHKKLNTKALFFFQFSEYSAHDKNVSPNKNSFRYLIKAIADYSVVSLSTSFVSSDNLNLMVQEKKRLAALINRPVSYSRLRYNKVNIPETYRNLVTAEFTNDYSMGYTHEIGFRAGTCTPFYFYDIGMELQQPLRVHPFAVHDYAITKYKTKEEIFARIDGLYQAIKRVNGPMITVFSNEMLGETGNINWLQLYEEVLNRYNG